MNVTIWHNPTCETSRNTLAMIRATGTEPTIIEYLQKPPVRALLQSLLAEANLKPRDLLREKGTPFLELRLDDSSLSEEDLIDAMLSHPILINRPLVKTPIGVRLCRPSEVVLSILRNPLPHDFVKENGEVVRA
jgi:arsenate reductase (glutaredoxin)